MYCLILLSSRVIVVRPSIFGHVLNFDSVMLSFQNLLDDAILLSVLVVNKVI